MFVSTEPYIHLRERPSLYIVREPKQRTWLTAPLAEYTGRIIKAPENDSVYSTPGRSRRTVVVNMLIFFFRGDDHDDSILALGSLVCSFLPQAYSPLDDVTNCAVVARLRMGR